MTSSKVQSLQVLIQVFIQCNSNIFLLKTNEKDTESDTVAEWKRQEQYKFCQYFLSSCPFFIYREALAYICQMHQHVVKTHKKSSEQEGTLLRFKISTTVT